MKTTANITFLILLSVSAFSQNIVFEINSTVFTKSDLQHELDKYPKSVLQAYIPLIKVVQDNASHNYCGCANWSDIEINASCPIYKVAIHHELSSLFLNRYDLYVEKDAFKNMETAFIKLNGQYKYHSILRSEAYHPIESTSDIGQHFFARKYSVTNFENDYNVIAEMLFSDGAKTIDFMLNNSTKPVAQKIKLVIEFYHKLDPSFTVQFFKNQHI